MSVLRPYAVSCHKPKMRAETRTCNLWPSIQSCCALDDIIVQVTYLIANKWETRRMDRQLAIYRIPRNLRWYPPFGPLLSTMQNLGSLPRSVWAVDSSGPNLGGIILNYEESCSRQIEEEIVQLMEFHKRSKFRAVEQGHSCISNN